MWFRVDDTFVASTHAEELTLLQIKMRERFEITVNDEVDSHLGVTMTELVDGSIKLTQPNLLKLIFDEYPPNEIRRGKGVPVPLRTTGGNKERRKRT
jgi:hypothetical protein